MRAADHAVNRGGGIPAPRYRTELDGTLPARAGRLRCVSPMRIERLQYQIGGLLRDGQVDLLRELVH